MYTRFEQRSCYRVVGHCVDSSGAGTDEVLEGQTYRAQETGGFTIFKYL